MGRCGIACLKYLMMLFNTVVFAAGIALVAVSVWVIIDSRSFQNLVNTSGVLSLFTAIWLIFAIGCALFLLGLMGCYGSSKESRIMLAIYFFLIFIIFVVEVISGVLAFVFYPEVRDVAQQTTAKYGLQFANPDFSNLTSEEQELSRDITKYWDVIQGTIGCCGYVDKSDWLNTTYYAATETRFPPSCCSADFTFASLFEQNKVINGSCDPRQVSVFTDNMSCEAVAKSNVYVLGGVALGVLVIEFLAMFSSCCMYRSLDEY